MKSNDFRIFLSLLLLSLVCQIGYSQRPGNPVNKDPFGKILSREERLREKKAEEERLKEKKAREKKAREAMSKEEISREEILATISSAEAGNSDSFLPAAMYYLEGEGVDRDLSLAFKYAYKKYVISKGGTKYSVIGERMVQGGYLEKNKVAKDRDDALYIALKTCSSSSLCTENLAQNLKEAYADASMCKQCYGKGSIVCGECKGTGKARSYIAGTKCSYCNGRGGFECATNIEIASDEVANLFNELIQVDGKLFTANELKNMSGLNPTVNPDSVWQIINQVEQNAKIKYDPDTLKAKWSLSGDGIFEITPKITLGKSDVFTVTGQGTIYLDSLGTEIKFGDHVPQDYDKFDGYIAARLDSIRKYTRTRSDKLGQVIVATSVYKGGIGSIGSPEGVNRRPVNRMGDGDIGDIFLFLDLKNLKGNKGSFYGNIIVERKKRVVSAEDRNQKRLRTTDKTLKLPLSYGEFELDENIVKFASLQLKASGTISTELAKNIPVNGLKGEQYNSNKRVENINYGAVMYKMDKIPTWKPLGKINETLYLTSNMTGELLIAVNLKNDTQIEGNFEIFLRKANPSDLEQLKLLLTENN